MSHRERLSTEGLEGNPFSKSFHSDVVSPMELDLFQLEMKTRKMIHDLVAPIVERMNTERQKMAITNERAQLIEDRVMQLEHICDVRGSKPKIFELI